MSSYPFRGREARLADYRAALIGQRKPWLLSSRSTWKGRCGKRGVLGGPFRQMLVMSHSMTEKNGYSQTAPDRSGL